MTYEQVLVSAAPCNSYQTPNKLCEIEEAEKGLLSGKGGGEEERIS